jgi:hypothetical protein
MRTVQARQSGLGYETGERVRVASWVRPERFAQRWGTVCQVNARDGEVGVFVDGLCFRSV